MKNLTLLSNLLLVLVTIFALSSCNPDDGTTFELSPTVELLDEVGFISANTTVDAGTTLNFRVRAAKGDNPLKTITILEDNVTIADYETRIDLNGADASSNPILIVAEADKEGFTWDISIVAQDADTRSYTIEVEDDNGLTDAVSIDVEITSGPLSIAFVEELPYYWADETFMTPATFFEVKILATRGARPITQLSVLEDGTEIADLTRIQYNGTEFDANPLPLIDGEQDGIEWVIRVRTQDEAGSTRAYTFEVQDEDGATESVSLNISIAASGTPVSLQTGILLNSAGPVGTGGLDLITGEGTGSADGHIKDDGIDTALPVDQNWKRTISGTNGTNLRYPSVNLPETFNFDNVQFQEEIQTAFEGSEDGAFTTSNVAAIGDIILAENGGTYFALLITEVNPTAADNNDNYVFSIKQ